ncbi:MAG: isochorismatase family cysteine hydrolase [Patescibacteria group bacterium]
MKKCLYLSEKNNKRKIASWAIACRSVQKRRIAPDFARAALLIVDMQRYFLDEKSHAFVPTGAAILPNVQSMRRLFSNGNRPVIFTRFAVRQGERDPVGGFWGSTVREGSRESSIVGALAPQTSEKVIRKISYSSFHGTDLEEYLSMRGVKNLVITGLLTHLCCEEAAREAFARGFQVFFVIDATASYNEEMHRASIVSLSSGFVTPVTTADIVRSGSMR